MGIEDNMFDVFAGDTGTAVMRLLALLGKNLENQASGLANTIADMAAQFWRGEAIAASPWGDKYANAIRVDPSTGGQEARVYVDEEQVDERSQRPAIMFVNMVEEGMRSFSIKEGLLNSKRVKTTTKGIRYIIVPFRYRTPKKNQKPASGFAGVMPKDVYALVKSGVPLRGKDYGHMAGLKRYDNEAGGHGQFFTFRMVTEKSQGWQHPGVRPTPVFEKVLTQVQQMVSAALDNYLRSLVADMKGHA
jgi:hypothetical protein